MGELFEEREWFKISANLGNFKGESEALYPINSKHLSPLDSIYGNSEQMFKKVLKTQTWPNNPTIPPPVPASRLPSPGCPAGNGWEGFAADLAPLTRSGRLKDQFAIADRTAENKES